MKDQELNNGIIAMIGCHMQWCLSKGVLGVNFSAHSKGQLEVFYFALPCSLEQQLIFVTPTG